ncbi:MAG: hypothetical protein H6977_11820 [Gammaproteobacteria bacterium]|nr:hypothetical protein [Gammaproteobacteria bacterium]MCP5200693.1 hypothetical protein [Gammaproteobacteria bacterium]
MSRECGDCTLCCKVLGIEAEGFASAQGEWCVHCDKAGGGCRIYDTRPEECDLFSCLWLQQPELPEELKPSRCRVVIGWYDDMFYLYVDPGRRDAWQRAPVKDWIQAATSQGAPVAVSINGKVVWANDSARRIVAARGAGQG